MSLLFTLPLNPCLLSPSGDITAVNYFVVKNVLN